MKRKRLLALLLMGTIAATTIAAPLTAGASEITATTDFATKLHDIMIIRNNIVISSL